MYKAKKFRVREISEVLADFDVARKQYRRVERIFLADGNALALKMDKLAVILDYIGGLFPECERVGIYGSPQDAIMKTREELTELRKKGVEIIYIGAESGSDKILTAVKKGATRDEIIEGVKKIEDAGIKASVTFISGLGGKEDWQTHAIETGTMISAMEPSYVGLLTLMVERQAPLFADVQSGKFQLLSPEEVVEETIVLLENISVKKSCVFRSNHASNYVSLKGDLPKDKGKMMGQLERVLDNASGMKDERLRML